MCTEAYKKMQTKRTYSEVVMRMRTSRVAADSIGSEFLKYAILAYLHDSSMDIHKLVKEAVTNTATGIHGITEDNPEEAIAIMREALEPVNKKIDESDDSKAVEKFIHTVAEEVKIAELVNMREMSFDIDATAKQTEVFIQTAIRRMRKPEEDFKEVLNWIAGKFGYESLTELMVDLNKIAMCNISSKKLVNEVKDLLPKDFEDSDNVFKVLEEVKDRHFTTEDQKKRFKKTESYAIKEIKNVVDCLITQKETFVF